MWRPSGLPRAGVAPGMGIPANGPKPTALADGAGNWCANPRFAVPMCDRRPLFGSRPDLAGFPKMPVINWRIANLSYGCTDCMWMTGPCVRCEDGTRTQRPASVGVIRSHGSTRLGRPPRADATSCSGRFARRSRTEGGRSVGYRGNFLASIAGCDRCPGHVRSFFSPGSRQIPTKHQCRRLVRRQCDRVQAAFLGCVARWIRIRPDPHASEPRNRARASDIFASGTGYSRWEIRGAVPKFAVWTGEIRFGGPRGHRKQRLTTPLTKCFEASRGWPV
jgi:hypothetical protein